MPTTPLLLPLQRRRPTVLVSWNSPILVLGPSWAKNRIAGRSCYAQTSRITLEAGAWREGCDRKVSFHHDGPVVLIGEEARAEALADVRVGLGGRPDAFSAVSAPVVGPHEREA
jgi:hypothetical protein